MKRKIIAFLLMLSPVASFAQRYERPLEDGWKFTREDDSSYSGPEYDDSGWKTVSVPHDWAIEGPFDMTIDAQAVTVKEDGENIPKLRTGRTGALPFTGTGWYRYDLGELPSDNNRKYRVDFDGAMSNAKVYLNGHLAGERPYGYISFSVDITPYIVEGGKNILAVRLENRPESSRWYPGAGLYRHVRLVSVPEVHIGQWGTYITAGDISGDKASVKVRTCMEGQPAGNTVLKTTIYDPDGKKVASGEVVLEKGCDRACAEQTFKMENIRRWDIRTPELYTAVSELTADGKRTDRYETAFGIREAVFDSEKGFILNGNVVKLKGVCMHHDLGPLGAAVNVRAMERQLELLKEMGCNAIRTAHNPPAPEFLDLCDRMGFLVMDESFDEWKIGKNKNGYSTLFSQWAEKDITDMIRRDRNHPSVIIWSIGNEIREQNHPNGAETARFLADICRKEDPTRPVTAGLNSYANALKNGFGDIVDIFGFNYKPFAYARVHKEHPSYVLLGTETASTVSSRGKYHFPVQETSSPFHEDFHCSSYDLEYPRWASTPDTEFAAQDTCGYVAGEFVWTGFDYLGEPTPYNETMSSRSSFFGIMDLAGMKKDRFWLYKSRWSDEPVLHLLPHWNWEGHEGENIPVHCYTNFNEVELFLNGKSLGKKRRETSGQLQRHRIIWDEVPYAPGELEAVAYSDNGTILEKCTVRTAGKPYGIKLSADRNVIRADGKDISFVEASIVDKDGNICPTAEPLLEFSSGHLAAICNGDPNSMESFTGTQMHAFSGKCMAIIGKCDSETSLNLKVSGEGLRPAEITVECSDCTAFIHLDDKTACSRYDGIGALVSYGKLLYDYPQKQRDEILDYLFLPEYGAGLQILKVELGYDGNNTAMSWPSYRRSLDEEGNFDRGYGVWYMKEAKKRNPDIILSALHWGYPSWATTDELKADFVADYVIGLYRQHGLFIDYIGGNQNESAITPDVTRLIRKKLDDGGMKDVMIICADEGARVKKFKVLDTLAANKEYADAVDVIGIHYKGRPASFMPAKAYSTGKRIWSSEDGGGGFAHNGAGHGWVDQLIKLLYDLRFNGAVRWLATASIYDNMPWPNNGIMKTKEPWSGHYEIGTNLWAFAHFTQFIKPGWKLMDTDSGLMHDMKGGYIGRHIDFCNPESGDWSIVATTYGRNIPEAGINLIIQPEGSLKDTGIAIWKSHFEDPGQTFAKAGNAVKDKDGKIRIHLDRDCVYTISTLTGGGKGDAVSPQAHIFTLPYSDDFESYEEGRMARYFVDANSTFETYRERNGNMSLRQCISDKPQLWHPGSRHVAQPVTEMGDMAWTDYSVSADVLLETDGRVLLGGRIDPLNEGNEQYRLEGYWLEINEKGEWKLAFRDKSDATALASGKVRYRKGKWTGLCLAMNGNRISAYIGGKKVTDIEHNGNKAGNVAFATLSPEATDFHDPTDRYATARFDNLNIIRINQ